MRRTLTITFTLILVILSSVSLVSAQDFNAWKTSQDSTAPLSLIAMAKKAFAAGDLTWAARYYNLHRFMSTNYMNMPKWNTKGEAVNVGAKLSDQLTKVQQNETAIDALINKLEVLGKSTEVDWRPTPGSMSYIELMEKTTPANELRAKRVANGSDLILTVYDFDNIVGEAKVYADTSNATCMSATNETIAQMKTWAEENFKKK